MSLHIDMYLIKHIQLVWLTYRSNWVHVSSVFVPKFLEVQRHGQNLPDLQSEWSDLGNTEHIAAIHLDGRGGTFPNCLTIISKHRCDYTQSCVFKPGSAVYLFFGTYLLGSPLNLFPYSFHNRLWYGFHNDGYHDVCFNDILVTLPKHTDLFQYWTLLKGSFATLHTGVEPFSWFVLCCAV